MTQDKLYNYLKSVDEVQILELLDISTEDILERFSDVVIERRTFLLGQMEILPGEAEELNFE